MRGALLVLAGYAVTCSNVAQAGRGATANSHLNSHAARAAWVAFAATFGSPPAREHIDRCCCCHRCALVDFSLSRSIYRSLAEHTIMHELCHTPYLMHTDFLNRKPLVDTPRCMASIGRWHRAQGHGSHDDQGQAQDRHRGPASCIAVGVRASHGQDLGDWVSMCTSDAWMRVTVRVRVEESKRWC